MIGWWMEREGMYVYMFAYKRGPIHPTPTQTNTSKQISMCRAAFHTGYMPHGILRLSKSQLDGACLDARFDQVGGCGYWMGCWGV